MPHTLVGVIPARGGSKRLPGKNSMIVGGKSLITLAVEAAQNSGVLDRILVDTDSTTLADLARESGAEVPFIRPSHLAQDSSSTAMVILNLLSVLGARENYFPDAVVTIQPTSPLRTAEDVRSVVGAWEEEPARPVASVTRPLQNPADLLLLTPRGTLSRLIGEDPRSLVLFEDGGVYVTPVSFLLKEKTVFSVDAGRIAEIPPLHGIDVDEEHQLSLAKALASWFKLSDP